jgi:60 kDa SS-A/Ro ribonucleoprotein
MQDYTSHYSGRNTKQAETIPGKRAKMVKNSDKNAYVFKLDDWKRLERFLVLGSSTNTYYATAKTLTKENAAIVEKLVSADGRKVVDTLVSISDAGRAPNNDPALFALAMCVTLGDKDTKRYALDNLSKVARIGTHMFHFVKFCKDMGQGWGRSYKRGVANWFNSKDLDSVAYQAIKYKSRDGWSMDDLIQLAHPTPVDAKRSALYEWITWGKVNDLLSPQVLASIDVLNFKGTTNKEIQHAINLIVDNNLPREVLPTELLKHPEVWEALLQKMPLGAMVRNLGKMTSVGLLKPMAASVRKVASELKNVEAIQRARLHPIEFLKAQGTYNQGHGDKGKLTWSPVPQICTALNDAFYVAFKAVEPTNKRIGLFVDVSGSMGGQPILGLNMTPREASVAMALVTANTEPNWGLWGFTLGIHPMNISPRMTLDQAVRSIDITPQSTDISLPMTMALKEKLPVDAFVLYTDNETNMQNSLQPCIALEKYRQAMGIPAKLIVVGMISNGISVADPDDLGSLDVCGFDTATPQIISDFIRE